MSNPTAQLPPIPCPACGVPVSPEILAHVRQIEPEHDGPGFSIGFGVAVRVKAKCEICGSDLVEGEGNGNERGEG